MIIPRDFGRVVFVWHLIFSADVSIIFFRVEQIMYVGFVVFVMFFISLFR